MEIILTGDIIVYLSKFISPKDIKNLGITCKKFNIYVNRNYIFKRFLWRDFMLFRYLSHVPLNISLKDISKFVPSSLNELTNDLDNTDLFYYNKLYAKTIRARCIFNKSSWYLYDNGILIYLNRYSIPNKTCYIFPFNNVSELYITDNITYIYVINPITKEKYVYSVRIDNQQYTQKNDEEDEELDEILERVDPSEQYNLYNNRVRLQDAAYATANTQNIMNGVDYEIPELPKFIESSVFRDTTHALNLEDKKNIKIYNMIRIGKIKFVGIIPSEIKDKIIKQTKCYNNQIYTVVILQNGKQELIRDYITHNVVKLPDNVVDIQLGNINVFLIVSDDPKHENFMETRVIKCNYEDLTHFNEDFNDEKCINITTDDAIVENTWQLSREEQRVQNPDNYFKVNDAECISTLNNILTCDNNPEYIRECTFKQYSKSIRFSDSDEDYSDDDLTMEEFIRENRRHMEIREPRTGFALGPNGSLLTPIEEIEENW